MTYPIILGMLALYILILWQFSWQFSQLQKETRKERDRTNSDLVDLVNKLALSIHPKDKEEWEGLKASDLNEASKLLEHYIGPHIKRHNPPLRKVIEISSGFETAFLNQRFGIPKESLPSEACSESKAFFWTLDGYLQFWSTHVVFKNAYGKEVTILNHELGYNHEPIVIWRHVLKCETLKRSGHEAVIETVLHDDAVKIWLIDGMFARMPWERVARKENILVELPLNEDKLSKFQYNPPDDLPEDMRPKVYPWLNRYFEVTDSHRWNVTVTDLVKYEHR